MSLLQARFAALGDTWQDQEHAKFSEEFRDTMKVLKKFIESSNVHTPFLLRKGAAHRGVFEPALSHPKQNPSN
jgi:hypothetical protein